MWACRHASSRHRAAARRPRCPIASGSAPPGDENGALPMPLAITEDHRALAEGAAAMVAGRAGTAGARRILLDREKSGRWWSTDGLWQEMVSTGWLALHVDERFGGQGYGLPELTIVLEQLGRAAMGGPCLPTVVVSAVIAEAGTDLQRERWLAR